MNEIRNDCLTFFIVVRSRFQMLFAFADVRSYVEKQVGKVYKSNEHQVEVERLQK